MAARGAGSIINVASIAAFPAFTVAPGYAATKAALINLSSSTAIELAPSGVRVNVIAPGLFDTELGIDFRAGQPERRQRMVEKIPQRMVEKIPMSRTGEHEELDGALILLASDASSYMTGSVITVDGGSSQAR